MDILSNLKNAVYYNNKKQNVISNNISRANIPGEKAFTLPDFGSQSSRFSISMMATNPGHIAVHEHGAKHYIPQKMKDAVEVSPDGNNIDLTQQHGLLSQTVMDTNIALEAYRKYSNMFKAVISAK